MSARLFALLLCCCVLLAGCGNKGPLVSPEEDEERQNRQSSGY